MGNLWSTILYVLYIVWVLRVQNSTEMLYKCHIKQNPTWHFVTEKPFRTSSQSYRFYLFCVASQDWHLMRISKIGSIVSLTQMNLETQKKQDWMQQSINTTSPQALTIVFVTLLGIISLCIHAAGLHYTIIHTSHYSLQLIVVALLKQKNCILANVHKFKISTNCLECRYFIAHYLLIFGFFFSCLFLFGLQICWRSICKHNSL